MTTQLHIIGRNSSTIQHHSAVVTSIGYANLQLMVDILNIDTVSLNKYEVCMLPHLTQESFPFPL